MHIKNWHLWMVQQTFTISSLRLKIALIRVRPSYQCTIYNKRFCTCTVYKLKDTQEETEVLLYILKGIKETLCNRPFQ